MSNKILITQLSNQSCNPIWDVLIKQEPLIIEGHANHDGRVKPIAVVVTTQDFELLQALKANPALRDLLEPSREEIGNPNQRAQPRRHDR
jgi:hypothetical protein